jgi:6-pyruvoyltetrahydropterin/6-carboxytetrahydropterin synthase
MPVFEISKTYTFEAAHSLPFLPPEHKCHHLHGHSYKVVVTLRGDKLNRNGMIRDFCDIDAYMNPLIEMYDHGDLNDHFIKSTSETIALTIYNRIKPGLIELYSVEVKETDKTGAKFVSDAVKS